MPTSSESGGGTQTQRARIAYIVLGGATGGIIALAVAMIWTAAKAQQGNPGEAAEKIFNMLVPLLGTWVGTVLAYYFSGENFQRASDSVSRLVTQVTDQRLRETKVTEAMLPRNRMTFVSLSASADGSGVKLQDDLIDKFVDPVTRLPVLDQQGVARFIIHQSFVYRFVTKQAIANPSYPVASATLKDFLDFEEMRQVVSSTMAFTARDSTLADAKSRMEAVKDCQDVFVTENGNATEPVLGWLTNTDITRLSRAD